MTEDLPEMRASDAERERVADALRDAVAEGRLTMEEFEERLDAAYRARTHGELEPLVRDLPVPAGAAGPVAVPAGSGWPARIGHAPTSRFGIGVLGGFERAGRWVVPRRFTALAFWGGGEIDLRDARFEDGEVVLRCFAIMGGVHVIVGPDVEVQVTGVGIMGGFDHRAAGVGEPGAPRVTVTGLAFWGGVGVERKLPRAELKRLKAERRELKARRKEERRAEGRGGAGKRAEGPHGGHGSPGGHGPHGGHGGDAGPVDQAEPGGHDGAAGRGE
ncbi:DUF1707 domain-containing protein [Streptomyces sp. NPDC018031]|uniref:DUF1707 SHOCT-like domain-containing protein n=1 Tax=Streptomyces sp. NPDC018031 TaxID=3365033 RepID=UPI00379AC236